VDKTIIEIIRSRWLHWFEHLNRLPETSFVKKAHKVDFTNKRPRVEDLQNDDLTI